MKTKRLVIVFVLFALALSLSGCGNSKVSKLAKSAEEQFLENDGKEYLDKLRQASGLSDLDFETSLFYTDSSLVKTAKTCIVSCSLEFTSDEIDQYYTTDYNSTAASQLKGELSKIKSVCNDDTSYLYDSSGWTVKFNVNNGTSIVVESSTHTYKYTYIGSYDDVYVDDESVYMAKNGSSSYSTGSSSSNSNIHNCAASGCNKEGTYSIVGVSGETEYYCAEHYAEINAMVDNMENSVGTTHTCAASGCNKTATHSIIGISGQREYYCETHYKEMQEMADSIIGE